VGRIVFKNIFTFFNVLCLSVAIFLIIVGVVLDPLALSNLAFIILVFVNTGIAIFQEIKAKKTLDRLSLLANAPVKVLVDGVEVERGQESLRIDDVIVLRANDQVPADCILEEIDCTVRVNEALITGESRAVERSVGDSLVGGSVIIHGEVRARVTALGESSFIGKTTAVAKTFRRPRSEILRSLQYLIGIIAVCIVILGTALVARQITLGILTQEETTSAVVHTAGALVGMVPSGLFLLVTLALANSVLVLSRHQTLVRDMYAIEMLARVDTLCLDKTGTLTTGELRVVDVIYCRGVDPTPVSQIISSMMFELGDQNQTSAALVRKFGKVSHMSAVHVEPFSSDTKFSKVEFLRGGTYSLGAPEFLLEKSDPVLRQSSEIAKSGKRVLVLAKGGQAIALIVLEEELRKNVAETIKFFKDNGVAVHVISGDNQETVQAIARACGIDGEVHGRTTPERKLEIIKDFKRQGKIVAMTGDGVNDILALKEAHCSISFASAQPVTRNISGLVLLDDDFNSLPAVVKEGRRIVNNVTRSSSLFLFKALLAIFLSVFALVFLRAKYLFEPRNLYILETFIVGIPSFALALERGGYEPIKGRFLRRVMPLSFLAAIITLGNIAMLYLFSRIEIFTVHYDNFVPLAILLVTITGLLVLFRQIQPLSRWRIFVFSFALSVTIALCVLVPKAFGMDNLRGGAAVLFVMAAITYLALSWLPRLPIRRRGYSKHSPHAPLPK